MSTTAGSNTNKPPSTLFSSLPNDLVLDVLARVPRRYYPILSCVSKKLRSLVRSPVVHETRSLLGKDSFYLCFKVLDVYHWFTLTENTLVSIPFPSQPESCSAALMVGPEIYFVGGYYHHLSRNLWILDSRSGKLRQGPSMLVARYFTAVGLVDEKIYVLGGCKDEEEIQVEVFDTKTQTWEVAPNPNTDLMKQRILKSVVSPSLDRKVYYVKSDGDVIVYDPRDGTICDKVETPYDHCKDVCVIDNVIYAHKSHYGLMWYDSKEKKWKMVSGLKMNEYSPCKIGMAKDSKNKIAMAQYNGKLVFLRERSWYQERREIWCAIITLHRSGVEIVGKVEWFRRVLATPYDYRLVHYLGRTD